LATKRRSKPDDEWYRKAKTTTNAVLRELGQTDEGNTRQQTVRELLSALVQIRNKTKAHGAVGPDFFSQANEHYVTAIRELIENCPAFQLAMDASDGARSRQR
jgi:hypothetical protein